MFNLGRKNTKKVRGNAPDFSSYEGKIPHHVAIIMDGNGRWANLKGQPRSFGHKAGAENVTRITKHAFYRGVKVVSLYAFSSENWSRPQEEIKGLFALLKDFFAKYIDQVTKEDVKIMVSGDITAFPNDLISIIKTAVSQTSLCKNGVVNIALNYGGRQEIVNAVNQVVLEGLPITEDNISAKLYTSEIGDPELIIRTSGELRLSNFMLFQSAYSEFYFTDVLWPDFDEIEFDKALLDYLGRKRRFGGINEE
ncbi:MAG: di-trans,poly-cis-decaprenylcistransferase [Clostridia bacterium]|nr:di-trans,poly-cis-decaprenylcistransferase [Clostridia bacterium]